MTFIVLEGGEGSGKSTQVDLLVASLRERGLDVVHTFEPGDTKLGARVREALLHGDAPVDARTELLLLLADRAQHVAEVIRPALERGAVVVSDRYAPSTFAYQGAGRGLDVDEISQLNDFATGGVAPDVVIVLDVPDDVAERRVAIERDRVERAGADFHARVREAYRILAAAHGWTLVDGTGTAAEVHERVVAVVSVHVR